MSDHYSPEAFVALARLQSITKAAEQYPDRLMIVTYKLRNFAEGIAASAVLRGEMSDNFPLPPAHYWSAYGDTLYLSAVGLEGCSLHLQCEVFWDAYGTFYLKDC